MEDRKTKFWNIFLGEIVLSFILAVFTPGILLLASDLLFSISKEIQKLTDLNNIGIKTFATYAIIMGIFWLWLHERNKAKNRD
jgi:hypothetical protein